MAVAILAGAAFSQDRVADLRTRFAQEKNPVPRAKLMPDLGDAEFRQVRNDIENQRLPEALTELQQFRDQARECMNGLDALKKDAERHSNGFKQLEISLSESLRRLDVLLVGLTPDEQPPFVEVRKDLDEMNLHLIEELFPRRPAPKPKPSKQEP